MKAHNKLKFFRVEHNIAENESTCQLRHATRSRAAGGYRFDMREQCRMCDGVCDALDAGLRKVVPQMAPLCEEFIARYCFTVSARRRCVRVSLYMSTIHIYLFRSKRTRM